jgi:ribosomal protein S6
MNELDTIDDKTDSLQVYEIGFHVLPTVDESSVEGEVTVIKNLIIKHEGTIISESFPTLINLAYTITKTVGIGNKDFDKAYFGFIKFEVTKSEIEAINKSLQVNPNILRFIIVKTVKENTLYYAKEQRSNKESEPLASDAEIDKSIEELITA